MERTNIAWCNATFNPWWGCTEVSPGCAHCYAKTFAKSKGWNVWGKGSHRRFLSEHYWKQPLAWSRGKLPSGSSVFVGSMCDWAETHPEEMYQRRMNIERKRLADLVVSTPNLEWLFLTKRIEDAQGYLSWMFPGRLPRNLSIGTTAENQEQWDKRIPYLVTIDCAVHFVSAEPQLERIVARDMTNIDWVICGGESGGKNRPFDPEWARSLLGQCDDFGVPFFMKQLGGAQDHRDKLDDLPRDLQVREFPEWGNRRRDYGHVHF